MCTDIKIFNPWGVRAVPLKPVGSYFTGMKEIQLTNGGVALVDDEDYDRINQWIGYYKTEEEAARAYDRMAIKTKGEFASLNFPYDNYD